ncbi:MAG TPA: aldose 1-epimerase family protein [Acidothermaceae bacterium]
MRQTAAGDEVRSGPSTPSGQQFQISHGDQHATVVEVGGGLRRYDVAGRQLLDGYSAEEQCTGARGLPLIPWPNRIQDGTYRFDGVNYQVPLTEPEAHNAIHGFGRWRNWARHQHTESQVVMGIVLHPQMGYPFTLDVRVDYQLTGTGLAVRTTATNIGAHPCPYGTGQHPYLSLGTHLIDDCELHLDAARWLPTDDRGLPTGTAPVEGSAYDFRNPRQIGAQDIDYTFTDLARDNDGLAWVHLSAGGRGAIDLWVDGSYPYIEIYCPHPSRAALAHRPGRRADDLPAQRIPQRRRPDPTGPRTGPHRQLGPGPGVSHQPPLRSRPDDSVRPRSSKQAAPLERHQPQSVCGNRVQVAAQYVSIGSVSRPCPVACPAMRSLTTVASRLNELGSDWIYR